MPWSIYSWGKSAYSASLQVKSGVSVSGFLPHHSCTSHSFIFFFFLLLAFCKMSCTAEMASKDCWFYYLIPISMWGKMASVLCKQGIPWSSFQSWWGAVRGCLSTLNSDLRARPFAPEGLILPRFRARLGSAWSGGK